MSPTYGGRPGDRPGQSGPATIAYEADAFGYSVSHCECCDAPTFADRRGAHHIAPDDRERGCDSIAPEAPLVGEQLAAVCIAVAWAEILEALSDPDSVWPWIESPPWRAPAGSPPAESGRVWRAWIESLSTFGELHDYCDANTFGMLCDGWMFADHDDQAAHDQWMALGNLLQDSIHFRLQRGEHVAAFDSLPNIPTTESEVSS